MKQVQDRIRRFDDAAPWNGGPFDQDDLNPKAARGVQFRAGSDAAGIFRDDEVDPVILQEAEVVFVGKGAAGKFDLGWEGQVHRRIDEAQKVMMLGLCSKDFQLQATDCQKDALRSCRQMGNGGLHVGHMGPAISCSGLPRLALQRDEAHLRCRAGRDRVGRHLGGKGVCRIDHMGDAFLPQVLNQPVDAAEASNPQGKGLGHGRLGSTRIRENGRNALIGKTFRHQTRFGRSAKKKDAHRV